MTLCVCDTCQQPVDEDQGTCSHFSCPMGMYNLEEEGYKELNLHHVEERVWEEDNLVDPFWEEPEQLEGDEWGDS